MDTAKYLTAAAAIENEEVRASVQRILSAAIEEADEYDGDEEERDDAFLGVIECECDDEDRGEVVEFFENQGLYS